jgi:hypothetical protein
MLPIGPAFWSGRLDSNSASYPLLSFLPMLPLGLTMRRKRLVRQVQCAC